MADSCFCYALCGEELIVCENRRKSAVKYFVFFSSPVVVVPHLLPTAICLLSFSLEWLIAMNPTIIDLTPKLLSVMVGKVACPLFRSPVVSCPAFTAYCILLTVFL